MEGEDFKLMGSLCSLANLIKASFSFDNNSSNSPSVMQSGGHTIVGLLDMVQNFDAGDVVNLKLDDTRLYAFGQDGTLISSPFAGDF